MHSFLVGAVAAAALQASGGAAGADVPPRACVKAVAPTGVLAPWTRPGRLVAAADERGLGAARLAPGRAVNLTLHSEPVRYPAPTHREPAGSFGGLVRLQVVQVGTYRVALASTGWIEVVGPGGTITSSGHAHGPGCSGIRKIVDFPLNAGAYTLQISGVPGPLVRVLAVRLP